MSKCREKGLQSNIKVSVIVPVYNVDTYLRTCIDSIIEQTLSEIEIICVNDGSTDTSLEILNEYAKIDSRITIISTENRGYGHAMNIGMDMAQGEYIGIVEPDDYVDKRMYKILYDNAVRTEIDIIKADFYRFYGKGENQKKIYNTTARKKENYGRIICPEDEKECFRFVMNTWSGIYRRAFIEKYSICHNETPGASYQDNGFWFKGFCYAKKIYFVQEPLYYNRRDNPGSSVHDKNKVYCANEEYAHIYDFLENNIELKKKYIYQYSMKKYHTYMFTLERIHDKYKKEYLQQFSKEFRIAEENNELSKKAFTNSEWENLHWIMRDSEEYYEKVVKASIQISVVIYVYNAEKFLESCLESIHKQKFTKFEVICVDDGSADSSLKILHRFAAYDKRFKVYSQRNVGAGAARNFGLQKAKGEYIIFLDADNYFAPEMLLHAWRKIRETESDICVMDSWQHDEETGEVKPYTYSLKIENYPSRRPFNLRELRKNPFRCFMGWVWDKLYRRSFILNHSLRFQELRTTNDMYFSYMSLFKAEKVTILDERLIYQRRKIKSSLSMTRNPSYASFIDALIAMKNELNEMGIYEENKNYLINYSLHSCMWNLNTLSEDIAKKLLKELRDDWFNKLEINELSLTECDVREEYEEYEAVMADGDSALCEYRRRYMEKQRESKQNDTYLYEKHDVSREEYYKYCLEEIRKSKSYKIGLALTWLPRKIRKNCGRKKRNE